MGHPQKRVKSTIFLQHFIKVNQKAESEGKRKTPVCIWGEHGIGKTELVEDFAISNGFQMAYVAPAQFEEMGDLLGMPQIIDNSTRFAPPAWVPQTTGPRHLCSSMMSTALMIGYFEGLCNCFKTMNWLVGNFLPTGILF